MKYTEPRVCVTQGWGLLLLGFSISWLVSGLFRQRAYQKNNEWRKGKRILATKIHNA